jgi:4-hydroxy-3-methylbut-2-enyl diphosphate reductase
MKLLLAAPRGYCAGVDRAVATVERALERFGEPVYVRGQIVHNRHVVSALAAKGAVFVDDLAEVPPGALVVFSAHGVSPAVRAEALSRGLRTIDATCPLVSKVHSEARRFAAAGLRIVLVGHAGHDEVEGTMGEAPGMALVSGPADVDALGLPADTPVAYLTQTTLSVDEARETVARIRERFPGAVGPPGEDVCYATQNRQQAVRELARQAEVVLVVGSANSSNSLRLVEVAQGCGARAYRIDSAEELDPAWVAGAAAVGVTSGASVPEHLVDGVIAALRALGWPEPTLLQLVEEHMSFALPPELR